MSRKHVVGMIIHCDGRYLCLQRAEGNTQSGKWGAPSGKVDPGESEIEAVVRETQEETGKLFDVDQVHLSHVIEHDFDENDRVRYVVYTTEVESQFEPQLEPREHSGFKWSSLKELREADDTIDTLTEIIEHVEASR